MAVAKSSIRRETELIIFIFFSFIFVALPKISANEPHKGCIKPNVNDQEDGTLFLRIRHPMTAWEASNQSWINRISNESVGLLSVKKKQPQKVSWQINPSLREFEAKTSKRSRGLGVFDGIMWFTTNTIGSGYLLWDIVNYANLSTLLNQYFCCLFKSRKHEWLAEYVVGMSL